MQQPQPVYMVAWCRNSPARCMCSHSLPRNVSHISTVGWHAWDVQGATRDTCILRHMSSACISAFIGLHRLFLIAGILYHDMYASDLIGTHVEMRSLEVSSCTYRMLHIYGSMLRHSSMSEQQYKFQLQG